MSVGIGSLTVFGGLAEGGNPGYSNIRIRIDVDSDATADTLQMLHGHRDRVEATGADPAVPPGHPI